MSALISGGETFRAGNVYIAWTQFVGGQDSTDSQVMFARSSDCGLTWSSPQAISGAQLTNQGAQIAVDPNNGTVYAVWRVFKSTKDPDEIMYATSTDGGQSFGTPVIVTTIIRSIKA